jgi:hypothetical protein
MCAARRALYHSALRRPDGTRELRSCAGKASGANSNPHQHGGIIMPAFGLFLRARYSAVLACAALVTTFIVSAGEGVAETFQCEVSKSKVRVAGRISRTDDQEFRDVPFTEFRFTQGGAGPGCVIVQFSATAGRGKGVMYVRAVLDAEPTQIRTILLPGSVPFAPFSADEFVSARAFNFSAPTVAPGTYTVRIQWRSFPSGAVFMHERAVIVQHQ